MLEHLPMSFGAPLTTELVCSSGIVFRYVNSWGETNYLKWLDKTKDMNIYPIPYNVSEFREKMTLDWLADGANLVEVVDKEVIWIMGHILKYDRNATYDYPYVSGVEKTEEAICLDTIDVIEFMVIDFFYSKGFEVSFGTDINGYYCVFHRWGTGVKIKSNSNRTKLGIVRLFEHLLEITRTIEDYLYS